MVILNHNISCVDLLVSSKSFIQDVMMSDEHRRPNHLHIHPIIDSLSSNQFRERCFTIEQMYNVVKLVSVNELVHVSTHDPRIASIA